MVALTQIYQEIVETGQIPADLTLRNEEKITLVYALEYYKYPNLAAMVKKCKTISGGFDEENFTELNNAYEYVAILLEKFIDDKNIMHADKVAFCKKLAGDIAVVHGMPSDI